MTTAARARYNERVRLPYTMRNELRGLIRRYLRLNAPVDFSHQAGADLVTLTRWSLSGWLAEVPEAPGDADRRLWQVVDAVALPGSVEPILTPLCALLGVAFSDSGAGPTLPRAPLLIRQNSQIICAAHRAIFSSQPWSSCQITPNLWHVYGTGWPEAPEERARLLIRHLDRSAGLTGLAVRDPAVTRAGLAGLIRAVGHRIRSPLSPPHAQAAQWIELFGPDGVVLTTMPDPDDIGRGGTLMGNGYVARVSIAVGTAADRVGLIRQVWTSYAD